MKKILLIPISLFIVILLFVLPIVSMHFYPKNFTNVSTTQQTQKKQQENEPPCEVYITVEGIKDPLPLEQYIAGVISAEMPSSFHLEALEAQAIASRTFVLKVTENGQKVIKPSVLHQVFESKQQRKKKWGVNFNKNEKKIQQAVATTAGEILTYNGELITAMFFSTSNGKTESAEEYSGQDIPYLQTVTVEGEKELSPNYIQNTDFSLPQWNTAFNFQWSAEQLNAIKLTRNSSNRVQTMQVGSYSWTGREIREKLNIPSTDFTIYWKPAQNKITVTTVGYGHGVGMSQYGAEALAREGVQAKDILKHFYKKASITSIKNNKNICLN
ncbi:stage II sporulation protein D [Viridibacillus arvi]|uniref:stage II sporulation protein D n=1 Tax=Viridibacillus arvi TaxID=263475 RepID=UPI0036B81E40